MNASAQAEARWLVATTQPRKERWAEENVRRQGFESYLPLITQRKRAKTVIECLFPRYLFVRTTGPWRFLTGTFGVSGVVMSGDHPASLSELDILRLRVQEDARGYVQLPATVTDERFKPGEAVRINEGVFSGYTGQYQLATAHDRVRVLLEYLGRQTPVEVASLAVEALEHG